MSEWFETLPSTHTRVWQTLGRGVKDRKSPARNLVLASAGVDGGAEARVVVLRAARPDQHEIEVHTDRESAKTAELERDPQCTALIWDAKANLQIRLRANARLIHADETTWARVPDGARQVYGGTPPPGAPLTDPTEHANAPALERFTRVILHIFEVETLHLGRDTHRRAQFLAPDWQGTWRAP